MVQCDVIATWWNIPLALYHIFREYLATWKNIFQLFENKETVIMKNALFIKLKGEENVTIVSWGSFL